jgi:hypothetical protein
MAFQIILVISSPSSSATGFYTLILGNYIRYVKIIFVDTYVGTCIRCEEFARKKDIDDCYKMLQRSYFQLWKDIIYIF